MKNLIIFGAGQGGRYAMSRLSKIEENKILYFADNDIKKQGNIIDGIRVISPKEIAQFNYDEIIIASIHSEEIFQQLNKLHHINRPISVYQLDADITENRIENVSSNNEPNILILTEDCISPSHGTGAVLLKHFKKYPKANILHGYLNLKGEPFLQSSYQLISEKSSMEKKINCSCACHQDKWTRVLSVQEFLELLSREKSKIDLIYANFFSEQGLYILEDFVNLINDKVPIIQHFHDILYQERSQFNSILARISRRIDKIWAIGHGIAAEINKVTGRNIPIINPFKCDLQPEHKVEHRRFSDNFSVVLLGNSHMPWVLKYLQEIWSDIRSRFKELSPIQWYAYPSSVLYVKKAGVKFTPDIEYIGFLNERVLHQKLCEADLAIIPFNLNDEPEYHYARFSIPSRMTEFLNAGLPIFGAAGKNTEAFKFITENKLGLCETISNREKFKEVLINLMFDCEKRSQLGKNARRFAEMNCSLSEYQDKLYAELKDTIKSKTNSL